jgi:cell division septum initiation protein DivIVA
LSDETKKDLDECQETVEKLQEIKEELEAENEHLREAADTFGDLAERLNTALQEQREPADPPADVPPPRDRETTSRKRP